MTISPFQHEFDGMGNEGIGKTNNLTRLLMYLGDPIKKLICTLHSCREKYESKIFHMLHKVLTGLGFSLKGVFNSHTQNNEQCHCFILGMSGRRRPCSSRRGVRLLRVSVLEGRHNKYGGYAIMDNDMGWSKVFRVMMEA